MNKTIGQLIKEDHWSTRRLAVSMRHNSSRFERSEMGKVKQAIQEVEEEVVSLVEQGNALRGIQLILSEKSKDNPYMSDTLLIEKYFNKAVWERDNEEEYHE